MLRSPLLVAFGLLVASPASAQEPSSADSTTSEMARRAAALSLAWQPEGKRAEPTLLTTPVLRCNDPTRDEVDGAVWLWLEGKRPVTAMCLLQFASGKWNYEFTSLTDDGLKGSGRPGWTWEPVAEPRTWTKLEEPVPATPRARQQALRTIARRLEAVEVHRGESFVLRLLVRPVYTYADEPAGILDGALFALTNGTNPEILLQLEARRDKSDAWHASFARLGSAALTVKLEGEEIWSAPALDARNPRKPYFAINELPE